MCKVTLNDNEIKKNLSLVMCVLYLRESCIIYRYQSACEFLYFFLSLINMQNEQEMKKFEAVRES